MKLNKLNFWILTLILVLALPATVFAVNDLTFSADTTLEVSTTDTASSETVTAVSGGNVTSLEVGSNYIDLSLDSGSDITLTNDGSIYFVAALQSGSGASYPSCPSSSSSLNITSTATAVVRVTVVATDPACGSSGGSTTTIAGGSSGGGNANRSTKTVGEKEETGSNAQVTFQDVEGHWGESYINNLKDLSVVEGRSESLFAPDDYLNRAEALKIALLLFAYDLDVDVENPFSDVSLSDWFFEYVMAGKFYSVIEGFEDETFRPGLNITRASALKILMLVSGVEPDSFEVPFSDVDGHWAAEYISQAYELGIVEGYEDGTFGPDRQITRAEFSKIAYSLYSLN